MSTGKYQGGLISVELKIIRLVRPWKELKATLEKQGKTIGNLKNKIEKKGDMETVSEIAEFLGTVDKFRAKVQGIEKAGKDKNLDRLVEIQGKFDKLKHKLT
jgi:hypothetical protein